MPDNFIQEFPIEDVIQEFPVGGVATQPSPLAIQPIKEFPIEVPGIPAQAPLPPIAGDQGPSFGRKILDRALPPIQKGLEGVSRAFQVASQSIEPYRQAQTGSPASSLQLGRDLIGTGADKAGGFVAETLAEEGLNPQISAGLGTFVSMTPDLLESAFFTQGMFRPIGRALNNFIKTKKIKVSLTPDDIREFRGLFAREKLSPEQYEALLKMPEEQMIRAFKTKVPVEAEIEVPRFGRKVLKPKAQAVQPPIPPGEAPLAQRTGPLQPPPEVQIRPPQPEVPPGRILTPKALSKSILKPFEPTPVVPPTQPQIPIKGDIYTDLQKIPKKSLLSKGIEEVKKITEQSKELADEMLGAISTRLKNIDPSLKNSVRSFEFKHRQHTVRDAEGISDIVTASKRMPTEDRAVFDLARKNSDTAKIQELSKKHGFDITKTRKVLDDIHARAKEVGYDIGYRKDYHPRVIKDVKGFLGYFKKDAKTRSIIEDAFADQEAVLGRILTEEEKAYVVNTMIRGYGQQQISLSKTGNLKERVIDVIGPELNQYYYSSDSSLVRYIQQVNEAIEARRFFGKGILPPSKQRTILRGEGNEIQMNNLDDSIGAYVLKLIKEGKIKPEQEQTLRGILQARFGYKTTTPLIGLYKNLTYIDTLGSPISAITQLEDLGISFYRSILDTPGSFLRAVMDKSKIKMKDLGIETIWEEMREGRKTSHVLKKLFDVTFFTKMDRIGKETTINSIIDKYRRLAKAGDSKELIGRIKPVFGDETQAVVKDLKLGILSDNVKLLAFNELLDVQPVALSEMPQKYLESPAGRVFYTLKTFTLKRIDFIRNEAIQLINTPGRRAEGVKRFFKLWTVLGVFGLSVDEAKDLILNRDVKWSDRIVDNLLKPFGLSKWMLYTARREGIGKALLKNIVPPTKFIDSLYKDVTVNLPKGKKLEMPSSIPIGGKLYYWWFGRGADRKKKKKGSRKFGSFEKFSSAKTLDDDTAVALLKEAKGDKQLARTLAKERGLEVTA